MRKIKQIILHCTATREGREYSVDTIRKWHVEGRGWSDIGYHYLVHLDGSISEGRPIERAGAHVKGKNRNSIGIAYVGGVEEQRDKRGKWPAKDTRTYKQKVALEKLIKELMIKFPEATLHGHNEFAAKACPSFDVQVEYRYLIRPQSTPQNPDDFMCGNYKGVWSKINGFKV